MIFLRSAHSLRRAATRRFGRAHSLAALMLLFMLLTSLNVQAVGATSLSQSDTGGNWLKLQAGEYRPGQLVVKFRDPAGGTRLTNQGLQPERLLKDDLVAPYHISRFETFDGLPGFVRYYTDSTTDLNKLATALSLDPQVESVEANHIRRIARGASDKLYNQATDTTDITTYRQWYLKKINIEALWDVTTGNNQVVAVVDTGINPFHEDLAGRVDLTHSYNFVEGYAPGTFGNNALIWDDNGHGTAVAGIIGAKSDNGRGIAGINWKTTLLSVKVLDASGSGDDVTIAQGIQYATDNQARIINLSLGGSQSAFIEAYAVQYAQNKGVLIVAAAGNSSDIIRPSYPAAYRNVLVVAATDRADKVTDFSSGGSYVSVAAPGADIFTTYCYFLNPALDRSGSTNYTGQGCSNPDPSRYLGSRTNVVDCNNNDLTSCYHEFSTGSLYIYDDGTSFSAPIVSGLASLIVAVNPNISNDQIKMMLEATATDIGPTGRDPYSGYGRVDAGALARALSGGDYSPNSKSFLQGIVTGANPNDVIVNLDPPNTNKNLDPSNGGFRFDNLGARVYQLRVAIPKRGIVLGPVALYPNGQYGNIINVNFDIASGTIVCGEGAVCPGNQNVTPGQPVTPTPPPPNPLAPNSVFFNSTPPLPGAAYFPDTGHNLSGSFRGYWEAHGGLSVFGFPISEEFQEQSSTDGRTYIVQYFQRNRFEFHPENNEANRVLLGLLGSELTRGRGFPPGVPIPNSPTAQYFPETGHTLSDRFLTYWNANGGVAIFGYPISEPIQEGPYLVQYFERNRFEFHPENRPPYDVLLGLLGSDLARNRNYIR